MELNKLNFIASQQAALNKQVKKEDAKPEEKKEAEVRDNKPAAQQVSGEDVLSFMATRSVDIRVKTAKPVENGKGAEDRIAGYMANFEAAFDEAAALGLSEDAILAILDKMA